MTGIPFKLEDGDHFMIFRADGRIDVGIDQEYQSKTPAFLAAGVARLLDSGDWQVKLIKRAHELYKEGSLYEWQRSDKQ